MHFRSPLRLPVCVCRGESHWGDPPFQGELYSLLAPRRSFHSASSTLASGWP